MMTHKTRGIVLRTVKYGETSLIVAIYTELFGLQSYLVNGVRTVSKKGSARANPFQPAAILDLVVYHNDLKNLQRIREYQWAILYQHMFFDVWKNAVACYMIELLQKTLKQPEQHPDLFHFAEDALVHLDKANEAEIANYPLFFALHLAAFFGFRLSDTWSPQQKVLDLQEGRFVEDLPGHPYALEEQYSFLTAQLLKVMRPEELPEIKMNQQTRRILLKAYADFYAFHFPDFGTMKSLPILQEILS